MPVVCFPNCFLLRKRRFLPFDGKPLEANYLSSLECTFPLGNGCRYCTFLPVSCVSSCLLPRVSWQKLPSPFKVTFLLLSYLYSFQLFFLLRNYTSFFLFSNCNLSLSMRLLYSSHLLFFLTISLPLGFKILLGISFHINQCLSF